MANIGVGTRLRSNATAQLLGMVFESEASTDRGFADIKDRRDGWCVSNCTDGEING